MLGGRRPNPSARAGAGAGLLGGAAGFKRKAAPGSDQENADQGCPGGVGGLDIFIDDEFTGDGPSASAPTALFAPGRSAAAASWTKLAGFEAGRKENVQRAGAWAGQRMKQAAAHSAPAAPTLEIFADPELQVCGWLGSGGTAGSGVRVLLKERGMAVGHVLCMTSRCMRLVPFYFSCRRLNAAQPTACLPSTHPTQQEVEAPAAAADSSAKPTLRQRLDGGGAGGQPEEELRQNPLHLHKVGLGCWVASWRVGAGWPFVEDGRLWCCEVRSRAGGNCPPLRR